MITFRYSVLLLASITLATAQAQGSPWKLWDHDTMEGYYAELKDAVCEKMGTAFAVKFYKNYPVSSKEAVQHLALHIDSISGWQECHPPRATATIGSKEIALRGDIALIIYDIYDGKGGLCKDLLKHIRLTPLKSAQQTTTGIWSSMTGYFCSFYARYVDLSTVSPERLQWLLEHDASCAEMFADQLIDQNLVLKIPVDTLKVLINNEAVVQRLCCRCLDVFALIVSLIVKS